MTQSSPTLELIYVNNADDARGLTAKGYEPIECAFGSHGSVLGPLAMDHHGPESWREGVAIRATRDHYGARRDDPRFVVTGNADADATLAIVALAALVPANKIPEGFADLVNRSDINPIDLDMLDEEYGLPLLAFQRIKNQRHDVASFHRAIKTMRKILNHGLSPQQEEKVLRQEAERIRLAESAKQETYGPHVMLVHGKAWGFDRWYRKRPVVLSYSDRFESITVGCRSEEIARELFGPEGLLDVFSKLGAGWGGRAAIGGSPRNEPFTYAQAQAAAQQVQELVLVEG